MKIIQLHPEKKAAQEVVDKIKLTAQEELLLKIIYSFHRNKKLCFMSNKAFADRRNLSERQISTYIGRLSEKGFIKLRSINSRRHIFCTSATVSFFSYPKQKTSTPPREKIPSTLEENFHHNNKGNCSSTIGTLEVINESFKSRVIR